MAGEELECQGCDRSEPPAILRVGIAGCGMIGRRRAEVVQADPTAKLVVVSDIDAARAQTLASETGCEAMADWQAMASRSNIDVVIVCTSNQWLAPVSLFSLQRGKHVLVEKPAARTPGEAKALWETAMDHPRGPLCLGVGFNHRYHPAIWQAHQMFKEGAIGGLMHMRCRYGHGGRPGYEREWRADPNIAGGGELVDQGIHAIDLFRWFAGEFTQATGFVSTSFWDLGFFTSAEPEMQHLKGSQAEDNAFALFRTAGGRVASLHASWTQWKNMFSFEVFGNDGYLVVDGLGGSYGPERLTSGRRRPQSGPPEEIRYDFSGTDQSWTLEWAEFTAAIRGRRQPLANGYDVWQALRMIHAVYQSASNGQVTKLVEIPA